MSNWQPWMRSKWRKTKEETENMTKPHHHLDGEGVLLHLYGNLCWRDAELLHGQDSFFAPCILYHHSHIHNVITLQDRLILRGMDGVVELQNCTGCGRRTTKPKKTKYKLNTCESCEISCLSDCVSTVSGLCTCSWLDLQLPLCPPEALTRVVVVFLQLSIHVLHQDSGFSQPVRDRHAHGDAVPHRRHPVYV